MSLRMVLASASPRRRELLEMLKIENLEIIPAKGEETADETLPPDELVCVLSRQKAQEVYERTEGREDCTFIGSDTIVYLDGKVLGKPADKADAKEMLRSLSGRSHMVYTGVTVIAHGKTISEAEETKVFFRDLSDDEIDAYIATGEPMDKAGAYGAQGIASLFVERLEGDFFNVMGLPICRLGAMLKKLGVNLL
ncbi:MAG: septum formation inhibitor Maf [Oscillospiraceae bacterium]|nr:septum formation inhibitor Maf [Oscillospiraceae bacterium]